jgi:hypothetical protein
MVKARSGSIWSGRKCAEDWTGNKWHGKVGSGSLGQARFHLARFGWAGLHWNGSAWIGKLGIEMVRQEVCKGRARWGKLRRETVRSVLVRQQRQGLYLRGMVWCDKAVMVLSGVDGRDKSRQLGIVGIGLVRSGVVGQQWRVEARNGRYRNDEDWQSWWGRARNGQE